VQTSRFLLGLLPAAAPKLCAAWRGRQKAASMLSQQSKQNAACGNKPHFVWVSMEPLYAALV